MLSFKNHLENNMKDYQRLIKNIIGLSLLIGLGLVVYFFFIREGEKELEIDDTPIHVESIKTIAEISTVSYRDEVVVDTLERHKGSFDLMSPTDWNNHVIERGVKRRLTIIYRGEVRYGLDLSEENYKVEQNKDTLWLTVPQPGVLDIIITPSETEVFQETGKWSDGDRKKLENEAKHKLKTNAENFGLQSKAKQNAERLLRKLVRTKKELVLRFE